MRVFLLPDNDNLVAYHGGFKCFEIMKKQDDNSSEKFVLNPRKHTEEMDDEICIYCQVTLIKTSAKGIMHQKQKCKMSTHVAS